MYKHDAMLHLVWTVATADKADKAESNVSKEEDKYLDSIREYEGIKIDWNYFNAKRKHLGYNRERIIDEACKAIRGCGLDWKIKAMRYMWEMSNVSYETAGYKTSNKEYDLIKRAQNELGFEDINQWISVGKIVRHSALISKAEALFHLMWIIAICDKADDWTVKWSTIEEDAYWYKVEKAEKINIDIDKFNEVRKKLN